MDIINSFLNHLAIGANEAFTLQNLWYCLVGVFLGTLVGVIPGLGALITISLLLPLTYHLDPTGALIMLAGVYFGADYGGATCSILLGVPGHPAAAVAVLDGYPMAKKGRGGIALFMKSIASFVGSTIGILLLMMFAPMLASAALNFGPPEYFGLMLLGLVAASTVGDGSPIKGLAMMVIGLLISFVGTDVISGVERFTFGFPDLSEGVGLIVVAMGVFAISEVMRSAGSPNIQPINQKFRLRDQMPTREDWKQSFSPIIRGASIGSFFGSLPGTGGGMATFLAYAVEKRVSKNPEKFGKGAIEGVAAPEACNNAGVGTAFIPTLTLGIPGDAIMALLLAGLIVQGIQPGPMVMTNNPELFWGLIVSFFIGNVMLLILNIPLIGVWVRLLSIPYQWLFPGILLFTCIGVFSTHYNIFDLYLLLVFGFFGYIAWLLKLEVVPLILGLILGQPLEENFRRAMLIFKGDLSVFISRPISAIAITVALLLIIWSIKAQFVRKRL
ncbi:tripartite tricarboxylate transporter permease [Nitrincola nitratireducens]|uniref:Tripartite tricarboxylate transporter TctA family protein n=1 Tax=Nitrincola nitratireducens TaxID=1229521 RepID=W9UZU2_9GAMM|nr:tripartite tricarboxylate transporter permease [Nitrincola nitratireducens]EXJ12599.1 Tripartite tricarboxylate transporter TctA family protein [Nitrincola nitratireducens]